MISGARLIINVASFWFNVMDVGTLDVFYPKSPLHATLNQHMWTIVAHSKNTSLLYEFHSKSGMMNVQYTLHYEIVSFFNNNKALG